MFVPDISRDKSLIRELSHLISPEVYIISAAIASAFFTQSLQYIGHVKVAKDLSKITGSLGLFNGNERSQQRQCDCLSVIFPDPPKIISE